MILAIGLWTAMACAPVEGDRILARDVAAAQPALSLWPPDTELGFAPAPGLRRVFRAAELVRLGRRQGIETTSAGDLCVERPIVPLSADSLYSALLLAVGDPSARIQMLDWSHYPVPHGKLEFPRTAAFPDGSGPDAPVLWKGFVQYGEHGRFSIWVRAKIEVETTRVRAGQDLPAGRPIHAAELRLETAHFSPFGPQAARTPAEVAGRLPRRPVPAGSLVFPGQLAVPPEVHAGETVSVRVTSGLAGLRLEGVAAGDGRRGDLIPVRNPATGRSFRARVEGAGKVMVNIPGAPVEPLQEK